jgi:hypothetical protein
MLIKLGSREPNADQTGFQTYALSAQKAMDPSANQQMMVAGMDKESCLLVLCASVAQPGGGGWTRRGTALRAGPISRLDGNSHNQGAIMSVVVMGGAAHAG